jgi:hypothetical protein
MRDDKALNTIRRLQNEKQFQAFFIRLTGWIIEELNKTDEPVISESQIPTFSESRAKAIFRASDTVDNATLQDFSNLVSNDTGAKVALYDFLKDSGLSEVEEVTSYSFAAGSLADIEKPDSYAVLPWLSLAIGGYAWKGGFPLYQLDPSSPPSPYSPADQVLKRAAVFLRRQVQRSATERDKINKSLTQPPSDAATLEELDPSASTIAPLPPHFRSPIPENYPEMASETLHVDPDESLPSSSVTIGDPLTITEDELTDRESPSEPIRMPPITIDPETIQEERSSPPSPMPESAVIMPSPTTQSRSTFTMALKQMFGQEELKSTKLRVIVQQYPDGPGLYGLQVRVTSKGLKSYVAGTTDRQGHFICELPVRIQTGLTYDVEVTWPRDEGGELERKSITLNADRTLFELPFYRQLHPPE